MSESVLWGKITPHCEFCCPLLAIAEQQQSNSRATYFEQKLLGSASGCEECSLLLQGHLVNLMYQLQRRGIGISWLSECGRMHIEACRLSHQEFYHIRSAPSFVTLRWSSEGHCRRSCLSVFLPLPEVK